MEAWKINTDHLGIQLFLEMSLIIPKTRTNKKSNYEKKTFDRLT